VGNQPRRPSHADAPPPPFHESRRPSRDGLVRGAPLRRPHRRLGIRELSLPLLPIEVVQPPVRLGVAGSTERRGATRRSLRGIASRHDIHEAVRRFDADMGSGTIEIEQDGRAGGGDERVLRPRRRCGGRWVLQGLPAGRSVEAGAGRRREVQGRSLGQDREGHFREWIPAPPSPDMSWILECACSTFGSPHSAVRCALCAQRRLQQR